MWYSLLQEVERYNQKEVTLKINLYSWIKLNEGDGDIIFNAMKSAVFTIIKNQLWPILDRSVNSLRLTSRQRKRLQEMGIYCIGQILERRPQELQTRNFGKKSVSDLYDQLSSLLDVDLKRYKRDPFIDRNDSYHFKNGFFNGWEPPIDLNRANTSPTDYGPAET